MEGNHYNPHPQLHHHYQNLQNHQLPMEYQYQQQPWMNENVDPSLLSSSTPDCYPQWSFQETKDFLVIRDDLDQAFLGMKRNKILWEVMSTKMREKGYHRSAEQCKYKWKNLTTRYKGCVTSESEEMRQQFPFFNDMQAIFCARMRRMLWAEEERGRSSRSGTKLTMAAFVSEDEKEEDSEEEERERAKKKKKKKVKSSIGSVSEGSGEVKCLLEDFMMQQSEMEAQWREVFEARECERRTKEMEWRQMMQSLEMERMVMDQRWREREEQRTARAEARAEKRNSLIAALLNELSKSEQDRTKSAFSSSD